MLDTDNIKHILCTVNYIKQMVQVQKKILNDILSNQNHLPIFFPFLRNIFGIITVATFHISTKSYR